MKLLVDLWSYHWPYQGPECGCKTLVHAFGHQNSASKVFEVVALWLDSKGGITCKLSSPVLYDTVEHGSFRIRTALLCLVSMFDIWSKSSSYFLAESPLSVIVRTVRQTIVMSATHTTELDCSAPSVYDRIRALSEHGDLFEHIDRYPQAGVYERFGQEWAKAIAYVEGEVQCCSDVANQFIQDKSRCGKPKDGTAKDLRKEFSEVMRPLIDMLLLQCVSIHFLSSRKLFLTKITDKVVKASQNIALAPLPTKRSMDEYRIFGGCVSGKARAANGRSVLWYGRAGEPVPHQLATIHNDGFDAVAQAIADWLMDPFLELITQPFRSLLRKIPIVGKKYRHGNPDVPMVGASTIMALARAFMVMIAILCLTAAILTLQVVKDPKMRILVVALYAQAFALPIQFLDPQSLPLYTLICS